MLSSPRPTCYARVVSRAFLRAPSFSTNERKTVSACSYCPPFLTPGTKWMRSSLVGTNLIFKRFWTACFNGATRGALSRNSDIHAINNEFRAGWFVPETLSGERNIDNAREIKYRAMGCAINAGFIINEIADFGGCTNIGELIGGDSDSIQIYSFIMV